MVLNLLSHFSVAYGLAAAAVLAGTVLVGGIIIITAILLGRQGTIYNHSCFFYPFALPRYRCRKREAYSLDKEAHSHYTVERHELDGSLPKPDDLQESDISEQCNESTFIGE